MAAVAMAFGCNHLFSLACEVDRDATAEELERLDSTDPDVRSKCRLLAPAKDRASDAAWYAAKYVAKAIAASQAANVLAALVVMDAYFLQRPQTQPPNNAQDGQQRRKDGFSNLLVCANRLTTSITMGLAMISYRFMGHKTYWASYDVKAMPTHAYTARALRDAGESTDATGDGRVETTLVPQGDVLRPVTILHDYDGRSDKLEALPPYLYHMFYSRQQTPKAKPKPKRATKRAVKRRRTGAGAAAAVYVDAGAASDGGASEQEADEEPKRKRTTKRARKRRRAVDAGATSDGDASEQEANEEDDEEAAPGEGGRKQGTREWGVRGSHVETWGQRLENRHMHIHKMLTSHSDRKIEHRVATTPHAATSGT